MKNEGFVANLWFLFLSPPLAFKTSVAPLEGRGGKRENGKRKQRGFVRYM